MPGEPLTPIFLSDSNSVIWAMDLNPTSLCTRVILEPAALGLPRSWPERSAVSQYGSLRGVGDEREDLLRWEFDLDTMLYSRHLRHPCCEYRWFFRRSPSLTPITLTISAL